MCVSGVILTKHVSRVSLFSEGLTKKAPASLKNIMDPIVDVLTTTYGMQRRHWGISETGVNGSSSTAAYQASWITNAIDDMDALGAGWFLYFNIDGNRCCGENNDWRFLDDSVYAAFASKL